MYEYIIMKSSTRKQTRENTKERRKNQICKVYRLKIVKSKLSSETKEKLDMFFVESKWLYNYILSTGDPFNFDTKTKEVDVLVKDKMEKRQLNNLSGAMRQAIQGRMVKAICSISGLKKKGYKTGRLKYKSKITSIPLRQYAKTVKNGTHRIIGKNKIKIQGIKQIINVRGLDQIPENSEYANANLIKAADDYYFNITTFQQKPSVSPPDKAIGIDFGCQTQLTLSDGTKIEFQVPVSERIKRLSRKISKNNRPKSNNKNKDLLKREKAYNRLVNKKKDIRNKIVNVITKNFKYVCFQNESIHAWEASGHGKKIQNSGIGGIIEALKHKAHTPIMVGKFFPSTQLCPACGCLNKIPLSERVYSCDCGFSMDRDTKSAQCILNEGLRQNKIPTDRRDFKTGEILSSTCFDDLSKIRNIKVSKVKSMSQEAPEDGVDHYENYGS